ncbi:unnamed protein product [Echinostoma caproni]|uniref:SPOC domain-containing protein n=1 Tax=Echinostoma caproni TaxID=27848 RepID=A0A183B3B8_9TREM|nr:unnamed protein product [Echinostoma caproni]
MKIPLDVLLSALPDEGKELLGTAFIAILASQRDNEAAEPCSIQSPESHCSPQRATNSAIAVPRMDPRLRTARVADTQALVPPVTQSAFMSSPGHFGPPLELLPNNAAAPKVVESMTSVVEPENVIVSTTSSPPAPTSPPREPDALELELAKSPVEPKEIPLENDVPPLSCSSPTSGDSRSFVPCAVTTESLDMDVESFNTHSREITAHSLSNSSDMDVEIPSSRYQSPFKIRYQPYTPPTPQALPRLSGPFNDFLGQDNPPDLRPRFFEPTRWHSPRTFDDRVRPNSPLSRFEFPRRALFEEGADNTHTNPPERTSNQKSQDCRKSESFSVPARPSRGASPSRFIQRHHSGSNISETSTTELRTGVSPRPDTDQLARFQINASPRLVLEDVAKTHPYYFHPPERAAPVYESEEGEIVDDDNEMDESEDGTPSAITKKRNPKAYPDGYYSSFSSDMSSNASLNVVDEWHGSSFDSSFSRSRSTSSRSSPQRKSERRKHMNYVNPTRPTENHSSSKLRRWLPEKYSNEFSTPYSPSRRRTGSFDQASSSGAFTRPEQTLHQSADLARHSAKSTPATPSKTNNPLSDPVDNSDHSVVDTETSLEDEDMRVPLLSRSNRRSFPSESHASRDRTSDPVPIRPMETGDNNPVSRSQVFSNKDVDYRRLPPEVSIPSPHHSHRDFSSGSRSSLPDRDWTEATEPLPRYSIYHPKSVDRERPDSGKDSSSRSRSDSIPERREASCSSESRVHLVRTVVPTYHATIVITLDRFVPDREQSTRRAKM